MNYIVLDLEWNQCPTGRDMENKSIPFEIIEIGAIKLNKSKKIISHFNECIKPQVYHEIHYKTKEIINIDLKELEESDCFTPVIHRFFEWCGTDYIFCTWGSMDLTELERNMKFYNITGYIDKPIKYYDIQKIFGMQHEEKETLRMLEYAVDLLHITKEQSFHRAINDAIYAAYVFQTIDIDFAEKNYSIDYYHNPKSKNEEIKIINDTYSKEITMEYDNKELALLDKDIKVTTCFKCGKKATKKIRWFALSPKTYYCFVICKEHGGLVGKLRIKKTMDKKVYIIKTIQLANEEDEKNIKMKQEEVRNKRKKKRNRKRNKIMGINE